MKQSRVQALPLRMSKSANLLPWPKAQIYMNDLLKASPRPFLVRMVRNVCIHGEISPAFSSYWCLDIKKAVTCMMFGGSRKFLPDRVRLRGDINVLLLGDPGTAKSQFLKFAEKVGHAGTFFILIDASFRVGGAHLCLYFW